MKQMVSTPAEKTLRKPRSSGPQMKKAKPALKIVEEQRAECEPPPVASRMRRPSYRPGSFGDPL